MPIVKRRNPEAPKPKKTKKSNPEPPKQPKVETPEKHSSEWF